MHLHRHSVHQAISFAELFSHTSGRACTNRSAHHGCLQSHVIVHRYLDIPLRPQIAFGRLDRRMAVAMHSKFTLAKDDRRLLLVVFRYTGEPEHPLSCLGRGTMEIRRRATSVFQQAVKVERLPKDLGQLLPLALWSLQMGLLVMFLYDTSAGQTRTRSLADGSLALTLKILTLAKLPVLKPVRTKILELLREADLLLELQR